MSMTHLTEQQAWLRIVECYEGKFPEHFQKGKQRIVHPNRKYFLTWIKFDPTTQVVWGKLEGLCDVIKAFSRLGWIDWNTMMVMEWKIKKQLNQNDNYLFPLDDQGHQQRIEFCKQQAGLCLTQTPQGEQS